MMTESMQQILQSFFGAERLEDVSVDQLKELVEEYPSFNAGHYLLSKKLLEENDSSFLPETQKTALYFHNPFWLQLLLQDNDTGQTKMPDEPVFGQQYLSEAVNPISNIYQYAEEPSGKKNDPFNDMEDGDDIKLDEEAPGKNDPFSKTTFFESYSFEVKQEPAEDIKQEEEEEVPDFYRSTYEEKTGQINDQITTDEPKAEESSVYRPWLPEEEKPVTDFHPDSDQPNISEQETITEEQIIDEEAAAIEERYEPTRPAENENGIRFYHTIVEEDETYKAKEPEQTEVTVQPLEIHEPGEPEKSSIEPEIAASYNTVNIEEEKNPEHIESIQTTEGHIEEINTYHQPEGPITKEEIVQSPDPLITDEAEPEIATQEPVAFTGHRGEIKEEGREAAGIENNTPLTEEKMEEPTHEPAVFNSEPTEIKTEEPVIPDARPNDFDQEKKESEIAISNTEEPLPELTFEPYHTIDYFASQGIQFVQDENPTDKFGKQLKSFTEWLKVMKKLPQKQKHLEEEPMDPAADAQIKKIAASSLEEKDVVTEAMAEVLIKQGMIDKAIYLYLKLSLLNPMKIAYFAAKIEELKKGLS